jgi:Zn-dependent protease with chaperone function
MAGDGLSDEYVRAFWAKAKFWLGERIPNAVIQICEVALLGGALLVAYRFSESTVLLLLYWLLLAAFALKIASSIALPKEYDSPALPLLLGLFLTIALTAIEHQAIKSASNAALIQIQGDKAARLIEAQRIRDERARKIQDAWIRNGCWDDERAAIGPYDHKLCNALAAQRKQNNRSADPYLIP